MMQGHYVGLQYLSPKDDLRDIAKSVPMIGVVLSPPAKIIPQQTNGYIIPWGVQIVVPEDNREKLDQDRLRALLYCPVPGEISNELDWFEEEDASDSFTHQFMSIIEYERRLSIVRKNLLKDPIPLWNKAKEEWVSDPLEDSEDIAHVTVKNPRDLNDVDFAPSEGMSLALAYEEVMVSIRKRERRHRESLRNIYKKKLIEAMFNGVPWLDEQREAFLKQWHNNFFKSHPNKKNVKPGRWEQCRAIA